MFRADCALTMANSKVCHRCRVTVSIVQCQYECAACNQIFCSQCCNFVCWFSTRYRMYCRKEQVCKPCYGEINKSFAVQTNSKVCHRCRVTFSTVQCQYECAACNQIFCSQCCNFVCWFSTRYRMYCRKEQVCKPCYGEINKSFAVQAKDTDPAEYINSTLAQQQQDMNIMKAEEYQSSVLKENNAMCKAETASISADNEVCHTCHITFNMVKCKHLCKACGQVFCNQCSSKLSTLPNCEIEEKIRDCMARYEKVIKQVEFSIALNIALFKHFSNMFPSVVQVKDTDLPAEYIKNILPEQ